MVNIYFRADGSLQIGMGHVIRCLALAEMLNEDFNCHFIISNPGKILIKQILSICQSIIPLQKDISLAEEAKYLGENIISGADILALDGYAFDSAYQKAIKSKGISLVCIDDILQNYQFSDVLINHAGGIKKEKYQAAFYTQFYLGLKYMLLRKPFLEAAKEKRRSGESDSLFLCMGGSDPQNYTRKIIEEYLPKFKQIQQCYVVIGGNYLHLESLKTVVKNSDKEIQLLSDLSADQMVRYMKLCPTAICSASGVSYEYLSFGGALYIVKTAENQQRLFDYLIQSKLACPLDDLSKPIDTEELFSRQKQIFDGKIRERYRAIFLNLSEKIILKEAGLDDVELYFDWANDPLTRQQSFHPEAIPFSDHKAWFQKKLEDPDCHIFTCLLYDNPAGQIRFDISQKEAVISYSVAKDFRGKGLGFKIIKEGILKLLLQKKDIQRISGFVKQKNIASCKTFKRLNFAETMANQEKFPDSYKFILNLENEQF